MRDRIFVFLAMLATVLLFSLGACQVASTGGADAETAAILQTANEAEIQVAEFAHERAADGNVKDLAGTLADEHRQAQERQYALFRRIGISPAENATSEQLRNDAAQIVSSLQTMQGGALDRAYLELQIRTQSRIYSLIDVQLIPRTQNDELRAELLQMREQLGAQLRRAQELQVFSPLELD